VIFRSYTSIIVFYHHNSISVFAIYKISAIIHAFVTGKIVIADLFTLKYDNIFRKKDGKYENSVL
jgi:hypothetical protein